MRQLVLIILTLSVFAVPIKTAASAELLIFGGSGHDVFLGCLNCSKHDSGSICNKYGKGSKYNEGIFNKYGTYGSKYSSESPWNKYASQSDVPVVVDRSGSFYGYLTINKYIPKNFNAKDLREPYELADGDLEKVQKVMCGL